MQQHTIEKELSFRLISKETQSKAKQTSDQVTKSLALLLTGQEKSLSKRSADWHQQEEQQPPPPNERNPQKLKRKSFLPSLASQNGAKKKQKPKESTKCKNRRKLATN